MASTRTALVILGASLGTLAAVGLVILYFFPSALQLIMVEDNEEQDTETKIAVVTDANFTDEGWGESSLNAARFIERKYNVTVAVEDNIPIPDIEMTLRKYAELDYDLIIAHGYQWGDPALIVAESHPETKLIVFTGLVQSENVASIFPQQQEGSFLLGALAGMMTKTGVIGFVGGEEYPNVVNILEGYKQGANWARENVTVIQTYLNDWDNPARGREAATSMIRAGADFVLQVADSSGHGVIQAANENGAYALGAVQDQNHLAPQTVLTSFVLDVDKAYDDAVSMVLDGNFTGRIYRDGLETGRGSSDSEGLVYLAPFHGLEGKVPEDVKNRLARLSEDIVTGKMSIPERLEPEVLS